MEHRFGVGRRTHLEDREQSVNDPAGMRKISALTPPSGPNIPAPGSWAKPAYRAPVNPARGLFPVPAARFVGTPVAVGLVAAPVVAEAEVLWEDAPGRWLLAALLTRWIV
jgi:hypothetical protein